jgi:hypothetical protein
MEPGRAKPRPHCVGSEIEMCGRWMAKRRASLGDRGDADRRRRETPVHIVPQRHVGGIGGEYPVSESEPPMPVRCQARCGGWGQASDPLAGNWPAPRSPEARWAGPTNDSFCHSDEGGILPDHAACWWSASKDSSFVGLTARRAVGACDDGRGGGASPPAFGMT